MAAYVVALVLIQFVTSLKNYLPCQVNCIIFKIKNIMAVNFFPKVIKFFDIFKKQNVILNKSVSLLKEIFDSPTSITELCKKIVDKEMEGNIISRDISISLAQTFITPIDREDIHAVNMAQEKVLNSLRSISTRIGLYNPGIIKPGAKELVAMLKIMHDEISIMIGSLEKRSDIGKNVEKVKQLKVEADLLLLSSMGEIYESQLENALNFLELIKWSHIYDRIEDAFTESEVMVNVIEGISLKYT